MIPGTLTSHHVALFSALPEEERARYIGDGMSNIVDTNTRKKMCVNYKNLVTLCASKALIQGRYYSKPAKLVAWALFGRDDVRALKPADAMVHARKHAVCVACADAHYGGRAKFFDVDLRTIMCAICKATKTSNSAWSVPVCQQCARKPEEALPSLLKPVLGAFPHVQYEAPNTVVLADGSRLEVAWLEDPTLVPAAVPNEMRILANLKAPYVRDGETVDVPSMWERLVIVRQWVVWFIRKRKPCTVVLWADEHGASTGRAWTAPGGASPWAYCLEPTEVDDDERLTNNRFLCHVARQTPVTELFPGTT
jgi:hypothetical protein